MIPQKTVTIDPGTNDDNKTGELMIDIVDNNNDEDDETFTVSIVSAEDSDGANIPVSVSTGSIVVAITDDENGVSITNASDGYPVSEDVGTVSIPFELEVAEATGTDVVVTFEITADTATSTDFTPPSSLAVTVTGDDDTKSGELVITIVDDDLDEPVETFDVKITTVSGGSATTLKYGK